MKTGSLSFSPSFPAKIANTSTTSTGWPIFLHIVEVPKGNLRDPTIRITVKFHTLLSPISLPPTRLSFPSFSYIFSRSTILLLSLSLSRGIHFHEILFERGFSMKQSWNDRQNKEATTGSFLFLFEFCRLRLEPVIVSIDFSFFLFELRIQI